MIRLHAFFANIKPISIRGFSLLACVTGVTLITFHSGLAQSTSATVSGTVVDSSGAAIPSAHVDITNTGTAATRAVLADELGRFSAPQLPPGAYEIAATAPGMQKLVQTGITLEVGQELTLTLRMTPGAVSETVNVTAEAPLVDTGTSSVSGVVDQQRISDLPLNGRDFSQLPLVEPGVTASRNISTSTTMGYGMKVAMAGSRPDVTSWLLDGTNVKGITNYGTPASVSGVMMGVDAVQEFRVLVTDFSADVGGTSGGVVNMITKSGTNDLHGSVYEFLRNSALDARNFFDPSSIPAFKWNQFGASVGGPIQKDKTFFFANYEGLVERQGITTVAVVPDANAHNGQVPNSSGVLQPVQIAPEIQPYLALWPLPNGPEVGGGLGTYYKSTSSPIDENYFVARLDHQLSETQSVFARFAYDQGALTAPDALPITQFSVNTRTRFNTIQYQNILSQNFLASSKLAFNRTVLVSNDAPVIGVPAGLDIFEPGFLPSLNIPGATEFSPTSTEQFVRIQNVWQGSQSFQYVHGAHTMRFGLDVQRQNYNQYRSAPSNNGTFTWSSLSAFLTDARLQAFSVTAIGANEQEPRTWSQWIYGAFFQDDWKVAHNLTLNLGARYEPFSVPSEKYNRYATEINWQTATSLLTDLPLWKNPSEKNLSPRVGLAWDATGDGKTAVRAGFGIFYVDLLDTYYGTPGQLNPPFFAQVTTVLGNLATAVANTEAASPQALSPILNPHSSVTLIQYNLQPSYEIKYNLSIERQLPGDFALTAGYVAARGVHLWRTQAINYAPATIVDGRFYVAPGTPAINGSAGQGSIHIPDAQSFYNALQLVLKKRLSRHFTMQAAYTWSKNIDDSTDGGVAGIGNENVTAIPDDPKADRGLSALDQAQTFVLNGTYMLGSPVKSGFLSYLTNGWQLSNIFTANSGQPFSVFMSGTNVPNNIAATGEQHPDINPDFTGSLITGNPNQWFNPEAFILPPAGFYGNAGRNILTGPDLYAVDLSLAKSFKVGWRENQHLDFRADMFNSLNHPNFAIPSSTQVLNPTTGAYIAGAGKITKTVTTSRQLQFSMRFVF